MSKIKRVTKSQLHRNKNTSSVSPQISSLKGPQLSLTRAAHPQPSPLNMSLKLSFQKCKVKTPTSSLPSAKVQKSSKWKDKEDYLEYLPVSGPADHLAELDLSGRNRSRVRKERRRKARDEHVTDRTVLPPLPLTDIRRGSLARVHLGGAAHDSDVSADTKKPDLLDDVSMTVRDLDLPTLTITNQQTGKSRSTQNAHLRSSRNLLKQGSHTANTAYEDRQRRHQLAEQMRRKHRDLYNKHRSRSWHHPQMTSDDINERHASFDSYDYLARYCILNPTNLEVYRQAYIKVDDHNRGWLSQEETVTALKEVNNKLSDEEQQFLLRIIEIAGGRVADVVDFRLFSTIAALSHRISSLDSAMRLMLCETNYQLLEMKTFLCERLWEVCAGSGSDCIKVDQLIVELRSGGISRGHEEEIKRKLGQVVTLDLVDFIIYSPLFFMIHQSIMDNPLSDSRTK